MAELMSSGEFAARSRLSAKALRLYTARSLLRPVRVDPRNGFRYYDASQLVRARKIILLRGLGMSLSEIESMLDSPDADALRAVETFWDRTEHEHEARRTLMIYVRSLLTEESTTMEFQYLQREVPAQRVISLQRRVRLNGLRDFWAEAHQLLISHLAAHGACLSGPIFGLFHGHVSEESDGPVELCVPTDSPVEPAGDIRLRITCAQREVYIEVTKAESAPPTMLMIHDALKAWIARQGLTQPGPTREVYYPNFGPEARDDEHVMDVALPLTRTL